MSYLGSFEAFLGFAQKSGATKIDCRASRDEYEAKSVCISDHTRDGVENAE